MMKKVILIVLVSLVATFVKAQTESAFPIGTKEGAARVLGALYVDSLFYFPKRQPRTARLRDTGSTYYKISDSSLYTWTGSQWLKSGGSGTGVTDGNKTDITVSGIGTVWSINNNVVTDAKLRQSSGVSLIGRSANSTGNVADIVASTNGHVLRRSSNVLGFGTIDSLSVPDLHSENYYNTKYAAIGSGGGTPAGSGTELQYRNSGSFGAIATSSFDATNGTLNFTRQSGDSALIKFDGNYTGIQPVITIRPPVKNDSTTEFNLWSVLNANDDGSKSNHLLILGSNYGGKKPTIPRMWDSWESNWYSGGARFIERHYEIRHPYNNENVRLFSSTMISRDSVGNSTNQWDFRANNFNYTDLKNNAFFSVSKNGNTTSASAIADLIGYQPYYKVTDNTGANQYTLFQQVGADLQVSALRNITLSSRQTFKTVYFTGMNFQGDAGILTTASNWGAGGLLSINPSHASTGVARFQHTSTDIMWIKADKSIYLYQQKNAISTDDKIQIKGTDSALRTLPYGSSSYTPTKTDIANISSATVTTLEYQRLGDMVDVYGEVTLQATANNTLTEFRITLPIASNLANTRDLSGIAQADSEVQAIRIYGDVTNDQAKFGVKISHTNSTTYSFNFKYKIK